MYTQDQGAVREKRKVRLEGQVGTRYCGALNTRRMPQQGIGEPWEASEQGKAMHVQHFWEDTSTGIWTGLEKSESGASRVTREVAVWQAVCYLLSPPSSAHEEPGQPVRPCPSSPAGSRPCPGLFASYSL